MERVKGDNLYTDKLSQGKLIFDPQKHSYLKKSNYEHLEVQAMA